MTILERIIATKHHEVRQLHRRREELLPWLAPRQDGRPVLDLYHALRSPRTGHLAVIAESKKGSPSLGIIQPDYDPCSIAAAYVAAGASAISVLTDRDYFHGHVDHLAAIRARSPAIPLLRKDFIIDELQIAEANLIGADSFLLIAACMDSPRLRELLALGRHLGMEPLVEIHDEEDAAKAVEAGARIIGINNRDLKTFKIDLAVTERLAPQLPPGSLIVGESGVHSAADARRLAAVGCSALLVGESLMRQGHAACGTLLAELAFA